jgi:hypothetical protein
MADIKWSAFPDGGAMVAGDQLVGLRSGANTRLTPVLPASATSITATGGTTTLTSSSAQTQIVNGTTFQIIQMPNTSTLTLGQKFIIINNTSTTTYGSVINDSTSTFMMDCLPGVQYLCTCTSTSDTTFTGWDIVALTFSLPLLLNYSNLVYTPPPPISINLATAVSVTIGSISVPINGVNYFNVLGYATNGVAFIGNVALNYGNVQTTGTLPVGASVSWTSLTGNQLISASNVNFSNAALVTVSFPKIAYITGTLTLGTTSFSTLTLSSLIILGAFTINSTSLTSVNFSNAQSIQGAFTITSGTALTTINLPSITFVGGAISGTAVALTSFVLTNLSYILGAFSLTAAVLTTLSLPSLIQIGGAWSTTMALVTTATFTSLQTVGGAVSASFAALATLTFPAIVSFGSTVTFVAANLVTFSMGATLKSVGGNWSMAGMKLDQASVDGILVSLAALDGTGGTTAYSSKTVNLSGGTSATPSATGLAAKAVLVARGCTVTNN